MTTSAASSAFVPGHVTVFFAPHWDDDPARTGSIGAGITLSDGVKTTVSLATETGAWFNGEPIRMEAVEKVIDLFRTPVTVELESPLTLGAGFGVSGAATLGVALALNDLTDGGRSENELITIAHCAEVEAGTGLGDVVAQARGGIPIRLAPGAPPHGVLDGIPTTARVEYYSIGDVETTEVLSGNTDDLSEEGRQALDALRETPRLPELFDLGRRFAEETGLLTPTLRVIIDDVLEAGNTATMALLGETIIALGSGLSDAGYAASTCNVHRGGSALVEAQDS